MRKINFYLCFITSCILVQPINAQEKMDASLTYIHTEKASFKSRLIQGTAAIFGVKKYIEKKILSNRLNQKVTPIPKSIRKKYTITEGIIQERTVWTLKPKQNASKKVVLYLHGGAYYWNISKYNWSFADELIEQTNATVIVPDYPLAPNATCEAVYKYMSQLYQQLTTTYDTETISIIGESAGGGLALGFTMFLRDQNKPLPYQLILLAPWLDVSMSNPEILDIDKQDKMLGIEGLQLAGKGYAGNLNTSDYRVSPIHGSLSDLPKISVFVGTHDLFVADSRKLTHMAHNEGIQLNYYEYPKMFHIWILIKKLKEAEEARKQIVTLILE